MKVFRTACLVALCVILSAPVVTQAHPDTIEPNRYVRPLTDEEIRQASAEEAARFAEILRQLPYSREDREIDVGPYAPREVYPSESRILDVPLHQQLTSYWCGPTSVLATIDEYGRIGQVSGTTEQQKQQRIANQTGTTGDGANTLSLKNTLNEYVGDVHNYVVKKIDSYSGDYYDFWDILYSTIIQQGRPIIVGVNTKSLPYYGGAEKWHYVVIDGMTVWCNDYSGQIERSISTVRVMDPNHDSAYYGYHQVLFGEMLNAAANFYPGATQAFNIIY